MCNLYAMSKGQAAIREMVGLWKDETGNLPSLPGIFPNMQAPVVTEGEGGRVLSLRRWGMPSPAFYLRKRNYDKGITNVRTTGSRHWVQWLGVKNRCVVPFTSFSEPGPDKKPVWFALDETRPLAFFAGVTVPQWTSVRKVKDGETTDDLFAFLTTDANAEVAAFHPDAMPVILTSPQDIDTWLTAETTDALTLQRPLPDGSLSIVARGERQDPPKDSGAKSAQADLF